MFHQFSEIKNGGRSQQTSVLSQLVIGESSAPELVVLKKAELIFQLKILSTATLFPSFLCLWCSKA